MLVGAVLTFLVQSSSVFTSTLTPLAGAGLVSLERAYPLSLGSNIGTTTTSMLAAFADGGDYFRETLQIALVHLFFNITGILLFYPIPVMRWPLVMARFLLLMFFVFPALVFALSIAGSVAMYVVFIPFAFIILLVTFLSLIQNYKPGILPTKLQNWKILPKPLRSLEPIDGVIKRLKCGKKKDDLCPIVL